MDVETICKAFNSLSVKDLEKCKENIDKCIEFKNSLKIDDYVDFHSNFVEKDSTQHKKILSELEALGFNPSSEKAMTKWLTSTGENYVWSSAKGKLTVKEPINLSEYPGIYHLMNDINNQFGTKLNSCLVSYYNSGKAKTRYHSDDET